MQLLLRRRTRDRTLAIFLGFARLGVKNTIFFPGESESLFSSLYVYVTPILLTLCYILFCLWLVLCYEVDARLSYHFGLFK